VADQRISQLTPLLQADVDVAVDQLPIADISTAETKKVTPSALVQAGLAKLPAGTIAGGAIASGSITASQLAANSVGATQLANGAVDAGAIQAKVITASHLADDTVTAQQLAPNAVGASELADGAVDAGAIQAKVITASHLADDTITAQQLAPNAVGSSELADGAVDTAAIAANAVTYGKLQQVSATDRLLGRSTAGAGNVEEIACTAAGRALLDDASAADQRATLGLGTLATQNGTFSGTHSGSSSGTNTGDQTITLTGAVTGTGTGTFVTSLSANAVQTAAIADGAVTAAKITADSLTAAQIAPNAIGASELADGAVDTAAIVDLAVTTPKFADLAVTTAKVAAEAITADKLAVDAVTTVKVADGAITDAKITGPIGLGKLGNQAANVVLAGPATGAAAAPTFRAIAPADLPRASAGSIGAVSAPVAGGLVVDANGAISLSATVAAGTSSVVTYDANGRITAGRTLIASDLPIATASAVGGVKVGTGLSVDTVGLLAVNLTPANIPGLDANKIVSGVIDPARIADKAITRAMLADYSISYVQEASPSTAGQHIGTLWLQESTGQLRMWNGNSWFPIGFGRLSAENLRYCGTFNAATGLVAGITQFGTQSGYAIGQPIPVAKDTDTGAYFVCSTPGNGTGVTVGVAYDAGDWILCNGSAAGWTRIDTLSGGGGGGGATHLNDLLDVTVSAPVAGQILVFDASGQWLNTADMDGGVY